MSAVLFTCAGARLRSSPSSLTFPSSKNRGHRSGSLSFAVPETAANIVVAAVVVGTAATLLARTTKFPESEIPLKACEDCDGSGLCSNCNGEGFVLKKQTEESAERARSMAPNAATRYTAGLPKKWVYCFKCNSTRSCMTCDGRGKVKV